MKGKACWFSVAVIIGMVAAVASPVSGAETIKIGIIGPFTGSLAFNAGEMKKGMELALDEANAKGGLFGQQIELIYGDSTPIKLEPGRTWVTVVRWLGDVVLTEEPVDMQATATVLAASFTPTFTITPGPSQTPEATLVAP